MTRIPVIRSQHVKDIFPDSKNVSSYALHGQSITQATQLENIFVL